MPNAFEEFIVEDRETQQIGTYLNLEKNPESFTGYQGRNIWPAIYQENCFGGKFYDFFIFYVFSHILGFLRFLMFLMVFHIFYGFCDFCDFFRFLRYFEVFMRILIEMGRELCHEEALFNRLISGLHASINSHIFEFYTDPDTKENTPNYEVYFERVGNFPERIENIYFAYSVLLRFF